MSVNNWIKYYRNSLADGEMIDIRTKEAQAGLFFNSYSGLNAITLSGVYSHFNKSEKRKQNKEEEETPDEEVVNLPMYVFISPFHINGKTQHGKRSHNQQQIFPFWIPAQLDEHGVLRPLEAENKMPWFIRSVLNPVFTNSTYFPIISSVKKIDSVLDSHAFDYNSWTRYWESVEDFFEKVTGSRYSDFAIDHYITSQQVCIIKSKGIVTARNILLVYDDLQHGSTPPPLISNLLSIQNKTHKTPPNNYDLFISKGHYGHYNNVFPLSNSQRKSLLIFENEGKGNILAVNGPPGTGKTTLLQNVVANEMVKAAIEGTTPPKIIASSTNNQAITNILDSFANTSNNLIRWLPNLTSLGSYLISTDVSRQDEAIKKGYQILYRANEDWEGYYFNHFEGANTKELEEYYISCHRKSRKISRQLSVGEITNSLKAKIKAVASKIDSIINTVDEVHRAEAEHFPLTQLPLLLQAIEQLKIDLKQYAHEKEQLLQFRDRFEQFVEKNKLTLFFSFIPPIKKRYIRKLGLLLIDSPTEELRNLTSNGAVESVLLHTLQSNQAQTDATKIELTEKQELYDKLYKLKIRFDTVVKELDKLWKDYLKTKSETEKEQIIKEADGLEYTEKVNRILDVSLRYSAFVDAIHYWEGQWILAQQMDELTINRGLASRTTLFNHLSYITPLFISTFHSLPGFTSYFERANEQWEQKPMYELFDLLIVDEAGQVSPEVGVAAFSLAQKALVVGDIYQIQPVWNIAYDKIDRGNLAESNLLKTHDFDVLNEWGVICSSGSLMHLAQKASTYKIDSGIGGTLLTEHRRCVDELVAFSNQHVYNNMLEPMVGSSQGNRFKNGEIDILLPPLSYLNIRGVSNMRGGSSYNTLEAETIAKWIHKYGKLIANHYNSEQPDDKQKELKDIFAVVTPFAQQRNEIYRQFEKYQVDTGITVGTVHSLQGAERPIVIFSPTYGVNRKGAQLFFDSGFNMLNVAITRAQHHFIVMGNMSLFNPLNDRKPSGALASYLFADDVNELSTSLLFEHINIGSLNRLDTLERHQASLKRAFEIAEKRIVIVSPFISIYAIRADNLLAHIKEVVEKGVEVEVYTDKYLDLPNGKLKKSSAEGRKALVEAGAKINILNGIHNKALAIDEKVLIEGSFNWLSAIRDKQHPHFRYEVSQIIQGREAKLQIEQLLEGLEAVKG